MKNGILITWHGGLGDAIICNAIVREYAKRYPIVVIPVKHHNVASIAFMFRDLDNVLIRPVEDDEEMIMFRDRVWKGQKLTIGCFDQPFNGQEWDREFYRQAGVEFQQRWDGWKCDKPDEGYNLFRDWQNNRATDIGNQPWAFVHDDRTRGFVIRNDLIGPVIQVRPYHAEHIFLWWHVITLAPEIHCISSSFALFIDSIELPHNPKLNLHIYARPGEPLPQFKKDWKFILK